MIIKCVACKKEFEQKHNERKCGCLSREKTKNSTYVKSCQSREFWNYMGSIRRSFQNPFLQFYKEFISTEEGPHNYKELSKTLKNTQWF